MRLSPRETKEEAHAGINRFATPGDPPGTHLEPNLAGTALHTKALSQTLSPTLIQTLSQTLQAQPCTRKP